MGQECIHLGKGADFMRKHRRSLSVVALLAVASVASVIVWLNQSSAQNRYELVTSYIATLNEILVKTDSNFYKEVDDQKMLEGAIRGAVSALNDPYSFYQSPEEQQREREDLFQAKFGGLGIRIYPEQRGDFAVVKVSTPLRNSPAIRAGLQPGDIIVKVDGESVILGGDRGLTLNDVVGKLRGAVGEPVTVTIERRNRNEPFDVTLVREEIKLESVEWTVVEPGIVYVSVDSFTNSTMDEFTEALRESAKEGPIRSLLIDVRGNRGGLLTAAKEMSDAFLGDGIIVSTQGRRSEFNHVYKADNERLVSDDTTVVVLVNGMSASGSEILAGAIKDRKRGILVGTKTFGKGVVQQRFELKNGGAVSLTISAYYTPGGTSIDGSGIEPNVAVEPEILSDEQAFIREKIREKKIIENFVLEHIRTYERERGSTPTDFAPLGARLSELTPALEENHLALDPRYVRLEARGVFDLNVGNDRLIDLENDRQLTEALHIVKDVGVANVLNGSYKAATPSTTATN
ncbi:S41 family peptidase [Candidatus Poribacteria bacterium]|nr:S41 family peptidase [Candidatus Poribacteria bacterium]